MFILHRSKYKSSLFSSRARIIDSKVRKWSMLIATTSKRLRF